MKRETNNFIVQRFKGLGEMNADELFDTTMHPTNRILKQLRTTSDEDFANLLKRLEEVMGNENNRRLFVLGSLYDLGYLTEQTYD